jgi:hypothetical protein
MSTDRTPHLLIPSCAQCDAIGLREMPELLSDIEERFGFEVLKAFLLEYGGRHYGVAVRPKVDRTGSDLAELHQWLQGRCVAGSIAIPLGPVALSTRIAWTIAVHLRDGWSLAATARAVACDLRTVSLHKQRLVKRGWLRASLPTPERETP